MDSLVWEAREAHRKARLHSDQAARFRHQRDDLIRRLYWTGDYSYAQLAAQIECSSELIAKAVKTPWHVPPTQKAT